MRVEGVDPEFIGLEPVAGLEFIVQIRTRS